MELSDWINLYEQKTGEKFLPDKKFEMFYLPDKGFCEYGLSDNMIIIRQLCGDGRYWRNQAEKMARDIGITNLGTWCIRDGIEAYIRLFGYKINEKVPLSDGLHRYRCINKKTGKPGLVSPAFMRGNGVQAYFITWEV